MPNHASSPDLQTLRLINLAERARALGHAIQADYLLLRAWTAYDDDSIRPNPGERPRPPPAAPGTPAPRAPPGAFARRQPLPHPA